MSDDKKTEYADREPVIPFKLKAFSKETERRFAYLINTVADYSPTGKSVLETAAKEADAETIGASAAYEIMVNGGGRAAWDALTEKAPQITKGMLDAAEREGAPLTHKMMQGAFDGWYKNPAVMRIYEDSYMMTECLGGSCDSRNDPRNYFKREMSSKEMVSAFCLDAEGKGYQSDRPNVLDEPERLQVQQKVLDMAKSVNENRRINGLTPDYSYRSLYLWGEAPKTVEKASNQAVLNAVAAKKMSR